MLEKFAKFLQLSGADPGLTNVDGRDYSVKELHPVLEPVPSTLIVHTLNAIADYIHDDVDDIGKDKMILHIESHKAVCLYSDLLPGFQQRRCYITAVLLLKPFPFNIFMAAEEFIIGLRSLFIQDENTARLLKIVGNIKEGEVRTSQDDGVSQRVTVSQSLGRVAEEAAPNLIELAPYRTFAEIDQPSSEFLFRMRKGGEFPQCGLFEADGGTWTIEAINNIKRWFIDELRDEQGDPLDVTILG